MSEQASQGEVGRTRVTSGGAMTRAMSAFGSFEGRVLRIGVVVDGRIVAERVIAERTRVRVGTAAGNDFVVTSPNFPAEFELFHPVGDAYVLNFTDVMEGRLVSQSGPTMLDALRHDGAARNAGSHWQIKLSQQSRGKVSIGNATFLFQFVPKKPALSRPQLPAAVRGGFRTSIDWVYSAFVTFSLVAHFGFVIYLENSDWTMDRGFAEVPDSVARMIFEEPELLIDEEETPPPSRTPDVVREPSPEPSQAHHTEAFTPSQDRRPASQPQPDSANSAVLAERMANEAVQTLIGAMADGGEMDNAVNDLLRGGMVTGNAEDVLAQVSGVGVAARGADMLAVRTAEHGSGEDRGLGSLERVGASADVREGQAPLAEERVRVVAHFEDPIAQGDGDPDIGDTVVRLIRQRMGQIRACYEQQIRHDSGLAGKVSVSFTVLATGTMSHLSVAENTMEGAGGSEVARCLVSAISRFRVNPPPSEATSFEYPFVFAPAN